MANLVMACHERDIAYSKQLIGDLPVPLLAGIDREQEVGRLLLELSKKACCVWRTCA